MSGGSSDGDARLGPLGLALCAGAYLAYVDRALPSAAATLIKQDLGVSDAQLGVVIATAFALAYGVTCLAVASLGGGGLRAAKAGIVAWTIGAVMLGYARSYRGFVAAEALIGAGQALFVPAAVAMIAGTAGTAALGRATARFTAASTLGRSSAALIAGLSIAAIGVSHWWFPGLPAAWRAMFLMTAALNLIVIGLIAGLRDAGGPARRPDAVSIAPTPWQSAIVGHFITAIAPIVLIQSVAAWFPTLLVRQYGLATGRAAAIAGLATLIGAPAGQMLGGVMIDRWPRSKAWPALAIVPGLGIATLCVGVMLLAVGETTSAAALLVLDLALGVAGLAGLASIQALTPRAARPRTNSLFFALVTIVGVGLGPLLVGAISDRAPGRGGGLAAALGWIAAATLVLAAAGHLLSRAATRYRPLGAIDAPYGGGA